MADRNAVDLGIRRAGKWGGIQRKRFLVKHFNELNENVKQARTSKKGSIEHLDKLETSEKTKKNEKLLRS